MDFLISLPQLPPRSFEVDRDARVLILLKNMSLRFFYFALVYYSTTQKVSRRILSWDLIIFHYSEAFFFFHFSLKSQFYTLMGVFWFFDFSNFEPINLMPSSFPEAIKIMRSMEISVFFFFL
jgi:hypothetical protein